jgi:hypothetical protein
MAEHHPSPDNLERLMAAGFQPTGTWVSHNGKVTCDGNIPSGPGVYAFLVGREVRYVGSAQSSLRDRMTSYERRQENQSSTRPVHIGLGDAIGSGLKVAVYTLTVRPALETGRHGLPVDYLVGLEAGLIQDIKPAWNRRGRKLLLDELPLDGSDNE